MAKQIKDAFYLALQDKQNVRKLKQDYDISSAVVYNWKKRKTLVSVKKMRETLTCLGYIKKTEETWEKKQ